MQQLHSTTPVLSSSTKAEETLIEKPELARRLDKSTRTVDAWMRKGYLPHIKIGKAARAGAILAFFDRDSIGGKRSRI